MILAGQSKAGQQHPDKREGQIGYLGEKEVFLLGTKESPLAGCINTSVRVHPHAHLNYPVRDGQVCNLHMFTRGCDSSALYGS